MISNKQSPTLKHIVLFVLLHLMVSCSQSKEKQQVELYETHCARCHIAPAINVLPKHLWKDKVLPEMAARMGIQDADNDPFEGVSLQEQGAIIKTGIYPSKAVIEMDDWQLLEDYIISNAPESLTQNSLEKKLKPLDQFKTKAIAIDSVKGSALSYLKYEPHENQLFMGTMRGDLMTYDFETGMASSKLRAGSSITDFTEKDNKTYLTTVGFLLPSEIPSGALGMKQGDVIKSLPQNLHRPVHTLIHDLDNDGNDEIVISEFGDLTGQLALWSVGDNGHYVEKVLLGQPGVIRVMPKDMNKDGKDDLVVLTSQGDEGISILYQKDNLHFEVDRVIRFPPIYGSSWFELIDYDNDGDEDLITVHGDNADETYVMKPYHGMRIHLNDGANNFEEAYFYPMNGCTRVIAKDFDQDGDFDMALLSTFPDYKNHAEEAFVYLQNTNAKDFEFQNQVLTDPNEGRWFLMDSGDIDQDGDEDLILSSLTYAYSPIPDELKKRWNSENTDILILENLLK